MKNRVYVILLITFILSSCKKNNHIANQITIDLVKSMVIKNTSLGFIVDSSSFYYDAQNRIINEVNVRKDNNSIISSQEIKYEYKSDSLIIPIRANRYKLNSSGLIENDINTYLSWYYFYDGNLFPKKTSFIYNPYPYTKTIDSFVVNNQNVIKQYQFREDIFSYGTIIMQYEYYNIASTFRNINLGKTFLGNSNTNLIKSKSSNSSVTSKSSGITNNSIVSYFYAYEFDRNNRVIKVIQTSDENADTTYTYLEYY